MNPLALMQLKSALDILKTTHPPFPLFLTAVKDNADVGTVIDITVTTSAGKTIHSKTKLNPDDIQLMKQLQDLS